MLLRMIETENFLSHSKESIALPDEGIFLLSGPSGSGKSSFIIDAMAYALFGAVATRAKRQADLVSRGSEGMSVRATFDFPARRIIVARGLDKRGSSWAQIYENRGGQGVLLAEGSAPVQRMIRRELGGMTWQQFYAAFVARQSEISMLTSLRGSERKALVQRMLGMRELEKASEIISANIRRFSSEASELERTRGLDRISELQAEIEDLRTRREGAQKEEEEAALALEQKEIELEAAKKRAAPLEMSARKAEERRVLEEKIAGREKLLRELEEQSKGLGEIGDIPLLRQSVGEMEKDQELLREQYRAALERESLEQEIAEIVVQDMPSLEIKQAELQELQKKSALLQADIELFDQRADDLRVSGKCDLCLRPFESESDLLLAIEEMESSRMEKEAELIKVESKIIPLESEIPVIKENDQRKSQRSLLHQKLAGLTKTPSSENIKKEGVALRAEVERAKSLLAKVEVLGESPGDKIDSLRAEIASLRESLPPATPAEGLEKAREEVMGLEREHAAAEARLPEVRERLRALVAELDKKERELQEKEGDQKKLEKWNKKSRQQEDLQTYLQAYQKHLAHEIRPALEEIGSEMIRRVSGGRHVAIRVDDNYEIEVEDRDGRRLQASMISGGEAVRANICLRLALTRLVSQRTGVPVAFLVLDEPLPAQDEGHIERIMELLYSLKPFYRQQFIISHVGNLAVSREVDYVLSFGSSGVELLRA